jgi:hypothetical protein
VSELLRLKLLKAKKYMISQIAYLQYVVIVISVYPFKLLYSGNIYSVDYCKDLFNRKSQRLMDFLWLMQVADECCWLRFEI